MITLISDISKSGVLAGWIGAIGTITTLVVGFWQMRVKRKAQKLLEKKQSVIQIRAQAEHVSAWADSKTDEGKKTILAVANDSGEPIYQVIVTIVPFEEADDKKTDSFAT